MGACQASLPVGFTNCHGAPGASIRIQEVVSTAVTGIIPTHQNSHLVPLHFSLLLFLILACLQSLVFLVLLHSPTSPPFLVLFETGSHYVPLAGLLELSMKTRLSEMCLSLPPNAGIKGVHCT